MEPVRVGVIGVGNMGTSHARDCAACEHTELVAIADANGERARTVAGEHGATAYESARDLMEHPGIEAVIVTTPHFSHTPLTLEAFERGLHVLVEKPVGAQVNDVKKMIDAHTRAPSLVFAAMFQQRTHGYWRAIKSMLTAGELGRLVRTTWIITTWFRTQAYYNSGGWRATWKGEGGGVLLNQCPHNLDLYQWFVGMPKRLYGSVALGKWHTIEVEDEVTIVMEHPGGMIGHFITSTAESPGTNRLEIVGENGSLVFDGKQLLFTKNDQSMLDLLATSDKSFDDVTAQTESITYEHHGVPGHSLIIDNFAQAVRGQAELIAPAEEGLASVELANATLLSHFTGGPVELPIDGDAYQAKLTELMGAAGRS